MVLIATEARLAARVNTWGGPRPSGGPNRAKSSRAGADRAVHCNNRAVSSFQLAQVNIALAREPLDAPLLADFVAELGPVNARADAAEGFVWRLQTEDGDATAIRAFDDDRLIVNMSVWESLEALRGFVYGDPAHLAVMRRRRRWFERLETFMVLWWVPAAHRPTIAQATDRLALLRAVGPSPDAFTFRRHFPAPDAPFAEAVEDDRDLCPA